MRSPGRSAAAFPWALVATCSTLAFSACETVVPPPEQQRLPDIRTADATYSPDRSSRNASRSTRAPTVYLGQSLAQTPTQIAEAIDGEYSINLLDVELAEASQLVLGDLLGERFVIDPNAKGRVTISADKALDRDGLLGLFETALKQNGLALIKNDDGFRVERLSSATQIRPLTSAEPGFGVMAVSLRFIGAEAAKALLQDMLEPDAIRVDGNRNSLFITGTQAERRAAIETIRTFDVDWMSNMSVAIFPVENTDPQTIIGDLESVIQVGSGGAANGAVKLRPLNRLNSILAIASSPELLGEIGIWLERLDVEAESTTMLRSYPLDSGRADDVAQLLSQLISGVPMPQPMTSAPGQQTVVGGSPGPSNLDGSAQSGGIRIVSDKFNNAILVLADANGHKLIERALQDIDRQPAQVLVDATIVEVTLTDRLRYGVQWFFETNGIAGVADSGRGGLSRGTALDTDGVFPGFNLLLESGDAARVAIDALDAVTNVKVRSSPSLMVLDNQSATLRVGDQVPVVTRQASSVNDPNPPLVNQIEFRETGVILSVTPHVSSTGMVTLEIDQQVSSVSESASTGTLTPTISQRRINSTVAVRSGQTLILGGLIDEADTQSNIGVPVLSQLPIVGPLFGSTDANTRRTELIVFLTPRVLRNEAEVNRAALELRDRMESIKREDDKARRRQGNALPPEAVDRK